jgi:hypothetical protein
LFRGFVQEYEYGAKDEVLSLTARQSIAGDVGATHDPSMRFGSRTMGPQGSTWDWDDNQPQSWWPVVFGKPGNGSASPFRSDHAYGSPAFGINRVSPVNAYSSAAGHPTAVGAAGGDLYLANYTTNQQGTVPAEHATVVNGLVMTMADINGFTSPKWTDGDEAWIDWGLGEGGLIDASGDLVRGAGDVLHWLALRSEGVPLDLMQIRSVAPFLNGYLIDCAIVPAPGEVIRPWDWAQEHVLSILPVSVTDGPNGLRLAIWRPDAPPKDAVAALKAGPGGNVSRGSAVESSGLSDVFNEFTLTYAVDSRTEKPTRRMVLTGDPVELELDDDAKADRVCRKSFARYGRRPRGDVTAYAVWDDATALRVLQWHVRRYALPSFAVAYQCPPEMAWLEPGSVVTVTDADVGLSGAVALVELVAPEATGGVRIIVRIYDVA